MMALFSTWFSFSSLLLLIASAFRVQTDFTAVHAGQLALKRRLETHITNNVTSNLHTSSGRFLITVHEKFLDDLCKADVFGDAATRSKLDSLFSGKKAWSESFCSALKLGVAWPDCPTTPEKSNLEIGCIKLPSGSLVPTHQGMKEMGFQAVQGKFGFVPEVQDDFHAYTIRTARQAIQHEHFSPLPPLHLTDGRHVALVSNRQFRSKMVKQTFEWHCKASAFITHGLNVTTQAESESSPKEPQKATSANTNALEVGLMYLGKIFHMVTDSYSMSHARRNLKECTAESSCPSEREAYVSAAQHVISGKEITTEGLKLLSAASVKFAFTMDDVDWASHAKWDGVTEDDDKEPYSDKMIMRDLAYLSVSQLLQMVRPLFEPPSKGRRVEKDSGSTGDLSGVQQRRLQLSDRLESPNIKASRLVLGRALCNQIMKFENISAGAGGSSPDVGRNGDRSNWQAVIPADGETKDLVAQKFKSTLETVDEARHAGNIMTDSRYVWSYPLPEDEDFCSQIEQFTCGDLGANFLNAISKDE